MASTSRSGSANNVHAKAITGGLCRPLLQNRRLGLGFRPQLQVCHSIFKPRENTHPPQPSVMSCCLSFTTSHDQWYHLSFTSAGLSSTDLSGPTLLILAPGGHQLLHNSQCLSMGTPEAPQFPNNITRGEEDHTTTDVVDEGVVTEDFVGFAEARAGGVEVDDLAVVFCFFTLMVVCGGEIGECGSGELDILCYSGGSFDA